MLDLLTVLCFVFLRHVARLEELFFGTSSKEEDEEDSASSLEWFHTKVMNLADHDFLEVELCFVQLL